MQTQVLRFIFPIDGDMLHAKDGEVIDKKLHINVCVSAPAGKHITINGQETLSEGDMYSAPVILSDYKNILEARHTITGEKV